MNRGKFMLREVRVWEKTTYMLIVPNGIHSNSRTAIRIKLDSQYRRRTDVHVRQELVHEFNMRYDR